MFLAGSNWNVWIDRQQAVVAGRRGTRVKSSCTCVGLDPRDRQANCFAWSQWMAWESCGKLGVKISTLLLMKHNVGQQTDLEQYSKVCKYYSLAVPPALMNLDDHPTPSVLVTNLMISSRALSRPQADTLAWPSIKMRAGNMPSTTSMASAAALQQAWELQWTANLLRIATT